jgi:peptidoglycan/xylan/chitin deacetylase (PgdA/CDA1 family)
MYDGGLVTCEVHGRRHVRLTDVVTDEYTFEEELVGCRDDIQQYLGYMPRYVAYSYGAKSEAVLKQTQKLGFTAAFSIFEGRVQPGAPLFSLRRVQVDRSISMLLFKLRLTAAVDINRVCIDRVRKWLA